MQVFAWDHYYPLGGYNDYVGEASNDEELRELLKDIILDNYQCVVNGQVVAAGYVRDTKNG